MSRPTGYVDAGYLATATKLLREFKQRTYSLMQILPGHRVLDAGRGPGTDTIPLTQLVGPSGQVIGVDNDGAMIAEANRRAEDAGVRAWAQHRRADASSLPFESDYFDSCRSERLFQHLPHPELARRLARFRTERLFQNGYAGRQLYRLFKIQKLTNISVEMVSGYFDDYG